MVNLQTFRRLLELPNPHVIQVRTIWDFNVELEVLRVESSKEDWISQVYNQGLT